MDEIKRWDVLKLDWVEYGMATIAIKWLELKWTRGYDWNKLEFKWLEFKEIMTE